MIPTETTPRGGNGATVDAAAPVDPRPDSAAFRYIVDLDSQNRASEDSAAWLRSPAVAHVWRDTLAAMVRELQPDSERRRAEVTDEDYRWWRRKIVGKQTRWLTRLTEAKSVTRTIDDARRRDGIASRLDAAEWAIQRLERSVKAIAETVEAAR